MEVDAARLHSVILSAQAEVDHHDPAIADDHVRGRQIAVDDPGPMEATDDLADPPCDLHRRRAAFVEDVLRGRTVDELHDDLVLDQIEVVENRHCDSGRPGFRHETRFVADARPAERIVERLETIRFGYAMLFDGGPSQELRSSELGLRAPLHEHAARYEAAEKNLSSPASR